MQLICNLSGKSRSNGNSLPFKASFIDSFSLTNCLIPIYSVIYKRFSAANSKCKKLQKEVNPSISDTIFLHVLTSKSVQFERSNVFTRLAFLGDVRFNFGTGFPM